MQSDSCASNQFGSVDNLALSVVIEANMEVDHKHWIAKGKCYSPCASLLMVLFQLIFFSCIKYVSDVTSAWFTHTKTWSCLMDLFDAEAGVSGRITSHQSTMSNPGGQ